MESGGKSDYDWGDMDVPYLDILDANVFESVDYMTRKWPQLTRLVSVRLLKISLLHFIKTSLRNSSIVTEASDRLPQEIADDIQTRYVRSTVIREWIDESAKQMVKRRSSQVDQLCKAVDGANEYFWKGL